MAFATEYRRRMDMGLVSQFPALHKGSKRDALSARRRNHSLTDLQATATATTTFT
ncbi:hypothetical protein CLAFUW4_03408 [Fulvia fulva]|uniref:Uncharacterized protein n=1 Tax=Passalora fulva TaxID=5499 RepID=A0A9Q8LAQ1_PASFU|nr:uncharacterized protein CLAFUR5_03389 [Fulvia fulva]KAK4631583.1 hypothetical protein CLAFUR4_03397 [Fulvia fulva]KAK4633604.1 hypothetical protein CLAFUR0_03402 [Fulvia fulva]UJO13968.1 hypothetical protein CLAFUR5_03389 [Fulvia fulva]WPV11328.1 hypothetical protein CLAFUW4_03408 [Fulvia fulva]WPV26543.1 hypothetical protein CLAFUW7_03400 [Fulvia fulva]